MIHVMRRGTCENQKGQKFLSLNLDNRPESETTDLVFQVCFGIMSALGRGLGAALGVLSEFNRIQTVD